MKNNVLGWLGVVFLVSLIGGWVLAGGVVINAVSGEVNASTLNAPTGRAATYVVCANDSVHMAQCDYVCDGIDDQVQIQAAVDLFSTDSQWDAFEAVGNWVSYTGGGVLSVDSNSFVEGSGALKSVDTVDYPSFRQVSLSEDWSEYTSITLWCNSSSAGFLNLRLYSGASYVTTSQVITGGVWEKLTYDLMSYDNIGNITAILLWEEYGDMLTIDDFRLVGAPKIKLSSGNFVVSNQINVSSYVSISGSGPSTRLSVTSRPYAIFYANSKRNIHLSDMLLDGAGGLEQPQGHLVYFSLCDYTTASNLFVQNADETGANRGWGLRFERCSYLNVHSCFFDANEQALRVCRANHFQVHDNIFTGVKDHDAIGICCPRFGSVTNNDISGISTARGAIWVGSFYRNSYDLLVAENIISGLSKGIGLIGNSGAHYNLSRVLIINNLINSSAEAITNSDMTPSNGTLEDIFIEDNLIYDSTNAIKLQNFGSYSGIYLTENKLINCTTPITNLVSAEVKRNIGYTTTNSGNASKANTNTTAHGLDCTPEYVSVTSSDADHIASVTAKGATTFTLGLKNYTGGAVSVAEEIFWYAEC